MSSGRALCSTLVGQSVESGDGLERRIDQGEKVTNGVVWYGMVWYGMVWYGMVWYGMVWYGMVWYGIVFKLCKLK